MMLRTIRRIGFFGGTFDPFHCGHLQMARSAAEHLRLHSVCFVPAGQNPLKGTAPEATPEQRVEMIRRGIALEPKFTIWEGELHRDGPSYTLETIEHLERVYPNCHLFWIIGSDQLAHLSNWYGIDKLVYKVRFILLKRPGYALEWPGIKGLCLYPVDNQLISVSATRIRKRLKRGGSLAGLVPLQVENFIRKHGLYS